jgi:signal transduction histidine kinase
MSEQGSNRFFVGIVWLGVTLALAAVALIALNLNQTVRKESEKAFVNNLKFVTESSAKSVELFMESVVSEVVLLIEIDAVKEYKTDLVDFAFRGIIEKHGESVTHWALVDGAGAVKVMVAKSGAPPLEKETLLAFYEKTVARWRVNIDDVTFIDPPHKSVVVGMPIWRKLRKAPLPEKEREGMSWIYPSGMVMAAIGADDLAKNYIDLSKIDPAGFSWLMTESGRVLAGNERMGAFARRLFPKDADPERHLTERFKKIIAAEESMPKGWSFADSDGRVIRIDVDNDVWYIATAKLTLVDQEWVMALAAPQSEVTRLIHENFWQSAILFLLVVGVVVAGGSFLTTAHIRAARAEEKAKIAAELEEKNRSLAELNRRMDDFVSVVSHDIRSPLNVIRGLAKLIQTDPDGKDRFARETDTMLRSCNRLMQLVNDILDVAKFEAGKMRLAPDPLIIDDLVNEAVMTMSHAAREKDQTIEVTLGDRTEMEGDVSRLLQVLNNLLANAIKFSPAGGVIGVEKRETPDTVTLVVTDTGPGIPEAERAGVFEKFEQLKSQRQGFEPGSGLGLAICKGVIDLHGGTIGVESRAAGVGSAFTVTLPRRQKKIAGS